MKFTIFFGILISFVMNPITSYCQEYCDFKYNYIWLFGDADDTIIDVFGGSEINFNSHPPIISRHNKSISSPFQNGSICSKSGLLALYSNGCVISNGSDSPIVGSESLNPGEINDTFCPDDGYRGLQCMIILPSVSDSSQYYIFHIDKILNHEPNPSFIVQSKNFYFTLVDVDANSGNGAVLEKHKVILSDTSLLGNPLTAVRHGNGTDWWIITPNRWNNGFYTILLDSEGPHFLGVQYVGDPTDPNAPGGQGKFNPLGNRFAWYHPLNGLFLYDFNRENGELSNFNLIEMPPVEFITGGCEFSPSGRYLYINHDTSLFQLDMHSFNIQESIIKIANFDGFADPLPTYYFYMERTPDKRIIMNVLNGSQYLHVIQEPEKKGTDCRFEQHAIKLPTVNNFTLPHFPNYHLGSMGEPLCDSIWVAIEPPVEIYKSNRYKVSPNPTHAYLRISSYVNLHMENVEVAIFDTGGSPILLSNKSEVDISDLPSGIYICRITDATGYVQIEKISLIN